MNDKIKVPDTTAGLAKSYKRCFPFKIAATSYILPDNILPNVAMLAQHLDEIELVLFEGRRESLPSEADIDAIRAIACREALTYNVHLPLDCHLGDRDGSVRDYAVASVKRVFDLTLSLEPSTYTIHFDLAGEDLCNTSEVGSWRQRIGESMDRILECGVDPGKISVENLWYPFEWVDDLVEEYALSVCLDIGHLKLYGYDIRAYARRYLVDTSIIHLYSPERPHRHRGLDLCDREYAESVREILSEFSGVVSLEVFSLPDLQNSLACLEKWI